MAEALLRRELGPHSDIEVASAGTVGDGTPPPPLAVEVMSEIGLDIAGRPSRPLTEQEVDGSGLIIGMERDHLVAAAVLCPPARDRTFTFTDLLRRAAAMDGRTPAESVADWAQRLGAGRSGPSILGLPTSEDVPDPMGRNIGDFERVRRQLDAMTELLAAHLTGQAPPAVTAEDPQPRRWLGRRAR